MCQKGCLVSPGNTRVGLAPPDFRRSETQLGKMRAHYEALVVVGHPRGGKLWWWWDIPIVGRSGGGKLL